MTNFGRGTSLILPLSIQCGINDTTLSDCATTDLDATLCPHVAGINCIGLYRPHHFFFLKMYVICSTMSDC